MNLHIIKMFLRKYNTHFFLNILSSRNLCVDNVLEGKIIKIFRGGCDVAVKIGKARTLSRDGKIGFCQLSIISFKLSPALSCAEIF